MHIKNIEEKMSGLGRDEKEFGDLQGADGAIRGGGGPKRRAVKS
jgi:hypothetical protein